MTLSAVACNTIGSRTALCHKTSEGGCVYKNRILQTFSGSVLSGSLILSSCKDDGNNKGNQGGGLDILNEPGLGNV